MNIYIILFYSLYTTKADTIFEFPKEQHYSDIIKVGQTQYDIIQQRSTLPKYGECWRAAVLQLNEDCRSLTEEKQQDLSLSFTNCFLEMSGHATYSCIGDKKPNLRRICISSMSDRAFNAYTEFYSHTQNMCFYLYNRIWHERAEETINLLNFNSMHVNKQLELSKELQSNLLEQQKEGLAIQNDLVHQGKKLSTELEGSQIFIRTMAENFTSSTKEQTTLLLGIFSKITSLQRWALSEMSWFSSTIYYILYLTLVLLSSSTKKTESYRLILLSVFLANAIIEYIITYNIANILENAEHSQMYINISKNVVRCICFFLNSCILLKAIMSYKDYKADNNKLLIELQKQIRYTTEIVEKLQTHQDKIMTSIKELQMNYHFNSIANKTDLLKEIDENTPVVNHIRTRSKIRTAVQKNEFQDQVQQMLPTTPSIRKRLQS